MFPVRLKNNINQKEIFEKYSRTIDELDFFSVRDIDKKIGVVSVAQWMLNYGTD